MGMRAINLSMALTVIFSCLIVFSQHAAPHVDFFFLFVSGAAQPKFLVNSLSLPL